MNYRCLICEGKGFFIETVKYSKDGTPLIKESKLCAFCNKDCIDIDELLHIDNNVLLSKENIIH